MLLKGRIYLLKGDFSLAKEQLHMLLKRNERGAKLSAYQDLGNLHMLQGKYRESIDWFKQGIQRAEELNEIKRKSEFHLNLAYLYLKVGDCDAAQNRCDQAWAGAIKSEAMDMQRLALLIQGMCHLQKGEVAEAEQAAQRLKKLVEEGLNQKAMRYYLSLKGRIAYKNKNNSEAIDQFRKSQALLSGQNLMERRDRQALLIYPIAELFFETSQWDKAVAEHQKIILLTTGRLSYGDMYACSFYGLGKIHEQKGWKGKAIESYKKFIDLWKECDPQFQPVVEDARQRVKELEGTK